MGVLRPGPQKPFSFLSSSLTALSLLGKEDLADLMEDKRLCAGTVPTDGQLAFLKLIFYLYLHIYVFFIEVHTIKHTNLGVQLDEF